MSELVLKNSNMLLVGKYNEEGLALLDFIEQHSLEGTTVFFEMNAITGELGELANIFKKEEYYNMFPEYKEKVDSRVAGGAPTFREQKVDEAGDVLFYFIKLLNMEGISLIEVLNAQKEKLHKQGLLRGKTYKK